jgi:NAD(P)-dependent dehydrogenase (short-subunit alcohol dehydrogenase family)
MDTLRDKVAVDVNDDALRALAGDLSDRGADALPRRADVSDPDAFDGVRDAAPRRFGRVDIVINSVGVLTNGLPEDIPVTERQRILDIDLMSVVRSTAAFLPLLLAQVSGHLVNTAIYLRPKNIGVTLLCPGPVLTNIAAAVATSGAGAPLRIPGEQFELLDSAPVEELRRRVEDWDSHIEISRDPNEKAGNDG